MPSVLSSSIEEKCGDGEGGGVRTDGRAGARARLRQGLGLGQKLGQGVGCLVHS